jgi:hypothetical protein
MGTTVATMMVVLEEEEEDPPLLGVGVGGTTGFTIVLVLTKRLGILRVVK